jgi:hypothetical protein
MGYLTHVIQLIKMYQMKHFDNMMDVTDLTNIEKRIDAIGKEGSKNGYAVPHDGFLLVKFHNQVLEKIVGLVKFAVKFQCIRLDIPGI